MSDNFQPVPMEMELVATSNKLSRQPPITLFSPKPNKLREKKKFLRKINYIHTKKPLTILIDIIPFALTGK